MRRHKTQVKGHILDRVVIWVLRYVDIFSSGLVYLFLCLLHAYINQNLAFVGSTPVNGESEQKKDDMEVEEKTKSPAQEENNDDTASSPNR